MSRMLRRLLHRRSQSLFADGNAAGLQCTIWTFRRTRDENLRLRLQFAAIAENEGDDLGFWSHSHDLVPAPVIDGQFIARDVIDLLSHRSICHTAPGNEIPGARSVSSTAHRRWEDMYFNRLQRSVRLGRCRRADVASRLDVG